MPIYVYRCRECGEIFEKIVSISSSGQKQACPKCASGDTEKQLAAVNSLSGGKNGAGQSVGGSCGSGGKRFT